MTGLYIDEIPNSEINLFQTQYHDKETGRPKNIWLCITQREEFQYFECRGFCPPHGCPAFWAKPFRLKSDYYRAAHAWLSTLNPDIRVFSRKVDLHVTQYAYHCTVADLLILTDR